MINFLLLYYVLTHHLFAAEKQCYVVRNKTVSSASDKLDCTIDNCWVQIDATSSQGIELHVEANDFYVKVFTSVPNKNIIKGHSQYERYYYAGPNEGFYLRRTSGNCGSYRPSVYTFKRVSADQTVCDPVLSYVGHAVKTIQHSKTPRRLDNCPYHILPENKESSSLETVYVLSPDAILLQANFNNDESNQETARVVSHKNWSSVDFRRDYLDENQNVIMTSIIAVSTALSCSCNETTAYSNSSCDTQKFDIQSPGYPEFLCPSTFCDPVVSFSPLNLTDNYIERKLVSLSAKSMVGISLQLKTKTMDALFDADSFSSINTTFLVDDSNLEVLYKTPQQLYIGSDGHFKMSVAPIKLRKDCECTVFNQKKYHQDYSKTIMIPYYCELMFCDWNIGNNFPKVIRELKITLKGGNSEDEMQVWNKHFHEIYNGHQLMNPRKLFIPYTFSDTHLLFWRKTAGENATISVSWNQVDSSHCVGEQRYLLDTTPQTIISSNYPMPYSTNGCKTYLEAPYGHIISLFISDFEVENFHDELNIYDGNTSEAKLIKHLTGSHNELKFNSTGNVMLLEFITDDQHSKKGFHCVATAVPNLESLAMTTTVPMNAEEILYVNGSSSLETSSTPLFTEQLKEGNDTVEPQNDFISDNNNISITSSPSPPNMRIEPEYGILDLLGIALIVTGLVIFKVAVFLLVKGKCQKAGAPNSFSNALVRFRAGDNDSLATIETTTQ